MTKLSPHFSLEELTITTRKNIDNTAPQIVVDRLMVLAAGLEQVRSLLGDNALHISSGYRCPELNQAIGSSSTSAHVLGYAVDFTCPGFGTPLEVAKAIAASNIKFDQLIHEGVWNHLSLDPRNRRELLTAHFNHNKTTYTKGIA